MATHDHPVFTWIYKWLVRVEDSGSVGRARSSATEELSGRVLIVGLGPGEDLHHLPPTVTDVVAVEPSPSMRRAAEPLIAKARSGGTTVELIDAVAEDLPLADDSVDGVLFAYVLCSVDDPDRAVAEARRVIRPEGRLAVLEHVRASPGSASALLQRAVSRAWPFLTGGCRCDRETRQILERGGFDTREVIDTVLVNVPPVHPAIMGTARPR